MILKNGKRIDSTIDTVPIGTVQPFIGEVAPTGYLLCQGQLVNKTTYATLYAMCLNKFGEETETHFRLPDLRGKTVAGYDVNDPNTNLIGKILGSTTHSHTTSNHTLTIDEMPAHTHVGSTNDTGYRTTAYVLENDGDLNTGMKGQTYSEGGSQPHNHGNTGETTSFQPTLVMNWMVKAFMVMPAPGMIYLGVEEPSDSLGQNGDLYIKKIQ